MIRWRLKLLLYKCRDLVVRLPNRFNTFSRSVRQWFKKPSWFGLALIWFSILDIIALGDIFEMIQNALKPIRPLTPQERKLTKRIFGQALPLDRIAIDERALLGPKQKRFAYVFCHTINSYGRLSQALFIHELVHIWHYHRYGLRYIPLAWKAQHSIEGYNYGGLTRLKMVRAAGGNLHSFNLEQQADIVADYYRLLFSKPPCWGNATAADLPLYESFVMEIQNGV